jgi:hypothetical protein
VPTELLDVESSYRTVKANVVGKVEKCQVDGMLQKV